MDFEINRKHLKGTAKALSEGALHGFRIPTTTHNDPGATVDESGERVPVKHKTIKVKMLRTKRDSFSREDDDGPGSHEHMGPGGGGHHGGGDQPRTSYAGPGRLPKISGGAQNGKNGARDYNNSSGKEKQTSAEYKADMEKMIAVVNKMTLPTTSKLFGPRLGSADKMKSNSMRW
jgi:hypothetical protein